MFTSHSRTIKEVQQSKDRALTRTDALVQNVGVLAFTGKAAIGVDAILAIIARVEAWV